MEMQLPSAPSCYVFDASSLIELERRPNGRGLRDMPDYPGKWLVIPSKVAKQVDSQGAPAETKNWIANGKPATFTGSDEARMFMRIRVQERLLEDADIQGIVIAYHRKGTYVVEEGRAKTLAKSLAIRCISGTTFLSEVQPPLL
jgi:hypothetical protein